MKKLLTTILSMLAVTCLFAQNNNSVLDQVNEKVNRSMFSLPRSLNAHEDAVFRVTLDVAARFEGQAQESDNTMRKWCSVVRIAPNWLIGSLTCRGTSKTATAFDNYGNSYNKNVAYRKITAVRLGGYMGRHQLGAAKVSQEDIFEDEASKTFLIYVNENNSDFRQELNEQGISVANLLIAAKPQEVLKGIGKAYVTHKGKASEVTVMEYKENKYYSVSRKGYSGDPLIFLSLNQMGAEFIAGLNVAEVEGTDVKQSRDYTAFNGATLNFLQRIIEPKDPRAWKTIIKYKADETTF